MAPVLAPKVAAVFRLIIRRGAFPVCWRTANVTPIPKVQPSSVHAEDYRPISITPALSKVFERLLSKRLCRFIDNNDLLPKRQYGFRKGVSVCDALLDVTHCAQLAFDAGWESRLVSLDFSSAFDKVNHRGLLYKLRSLGVGGHFYNIVANFLTDRKQRVVVDGHLGPFGLVRSGVPQGSVLGPVLFNLYTADMWNGIESHMVAYADDTTLIMPVPSLQDRRVVAETLTRDILKIMSWCNCWGMKLNPNKSQSLVFSRSRSPDPPHPDIVIGDSRVKNCCTLKLLGVVLDSKLTFEPHLRLTASSISQKIGLLRKCWKIYSSDDVVRNCFYSFILPLFEYCSPVWCSASEVHLKLLDRVFNQIKFLLPSVVLKLEHRRMVGALSLMFKIASSNNHPLFNILPPPNQPSRTTRYSLNLNDRAFSVSLCRTTQFSRCFVPAVTRLWNTLPNCIVCSSDVGTFKSQVNSYLLS